MGVSHPSQSEQVKQKKFETCLEHFGTKNYAQSDVVKSKIRETNQTRYGVACVFSSPIIRQKIEDTILMRTPVQLLETLQKRRKTCLDKYGVDNPMKNAIVADHMCKRTKQIKIYTLPSGKDIIFQGYENKVLDVLVTFLHENDIITQRSLVPEVWYSMDDGQYHRYFVDIYIPSLNILVEVKSTWTLEKAGNKINYKRKACEYLGYKFMLFVFDKHTLINHFDIKSTLVENGNHPSSIHMSQPKK